MTTMATVSGETVRAARAEPPRSAREAPRLLAFGHSAFLLFGGLWPLLHYRSFTAVLGPKKDDWLVKTVGTLLTAVGLAGLVAAFRDRVTPEIRIGEAGASAALIGIDAVYIPRGRISKMYILDGALHLVFVIGWAVAWIAERPGSAAANWSRASEGAG